MPPLAFGVWEIRWQLSECRKAIACLVDCSLDVKSRYVTTLLLVLLTMTSLRSTD